MKSLFVRLWLFSLLFATCSVFAAVQPPVSEERRIELRAIAMNQDASLQERLVALKEMYRHMLNADGSVPSRRVCIWDPIGKNGPIYAAAQDQVTRLLEWEIPGDHGTTFGGNPVACAAANAVIETLTAGNVLEEVPVLSEEMFKQLESLADRKSIVNEIRGRGLMIAVEFDKDIAADVVNECRELGLLLNNVRPNTVRFLPPLTITKEEIQQACQILEKSIEKVTT